MVTPKPEDDVNTYMDNWAQQSGLLKFQPDAMRIGWDFPFVYEKEGITCMDVYIHVDSVSKTDFFTNFS